MSTDAERIGAWIRDMPLRQQTVVTGATLILADVKGRNPGTFDDVDELIIREASSPAASRDYAASVAERYRPSVDQSADHSRIVGVCDAVVGAIEGAFPGL